MGKEIAVKIVSIGRAKETKVGIVQEVEIQSLDPLGQIIKVGIFLNQNPFLFKAGDEVFMTIDNKPWKNKYGKMCDSFSASLDLIRKIEPSPTVFPTLGEKLNETVTTTEEKPKEKTAKELKEIENAVDLERWLTYFQRVEAMLQLFKEKENTAENALAGAILGIREMMFNVRKY